MYGLIAVPIVAVGVAYGMGSFTKAPSPDDSSLPPLTPTAWKSPSALETALEEEKAAKADRERMSAGRRKKTKKSKSKNKKTNRRKH